MSAEAGIQFPSFRGSMLISCGKMVVHAGGRAPFCSLASSSSQLQLHCTRLLLQRQRILSPGRHGPQRSLVHIVAEVAEAAEQQKSIAGPSTLTPHRALQRQQVSSLLTMIAQGETLRLF